jgi:hypothetical protein
MKNYLNYLLLTVLFSLPWELSAQVVSYKHGDTIEIPCVAAEKPLPGGIRTAIMVNDTKLSLIGTWDANDLDVILNGNTVRFALKRATATPVGVLGSSGIYYYFLVTPVPPEQGAQLSPVVQIINEASNPELAQNKSNVDTTGAAGGHWENTTNSWIRLHKHIRGGRIIPNIQGKEEYNEEILKNEKRRVLGKIWNENDDYLVKEYYSWTLNDVTASYIGVTYRGTLEVGDFNYLQHQTDKGISIWHARRSDDRSPLSVVYPAIPMQRNQEEFFLLYKKTSP